MNPLAMALVLIVLLGVFAVSARKRFALLSVGDATWESRTDQVPRRLGLVWNFALLQKKMRYYLTAGVAHQLIFLGFVVLLLRTLILWGRGFDPSFNLVILGPDGFLGLPLGNIYSFVKDVFSLLVIAGAAVFIYYRTVKPQKRMALTLEGLIILGIIVVMMLADILYDGASTVLLFNHERLCAAGGPCDAAATIIAPLGDAPQALTWSLQ